MSPDGLMNCVAVNTRPPPLHIVYALVYVVVYKIIMKLIIVSFAWFSM